MDIRELRIGNSVLVNGVKAKVIDIHKDVMNWDKSPYRIFVEGISPETGELMQVGAFVASDSVQPIPITEELLKELGFEKSETNQYDWYKYIDDFSIFIKIFKRGRCRAEVYSEFSHHGNMVCYYLNELEQFVFMTTKKELI